MRSKRTPRPILVIENNAEQWLITRSILAECFPEVEPVWINDSAQALTYLQTHAANSNTLPRLILLEMYCPHREDGIAVLEFVKKHIFRCKPPIIVLSGSSDPNDITMAYSLGITSYIIKPVTPTDWQNCFYIFRHYWWEIVTLFNK